MLPVVALGYMYGAAGADCTPNAGVPVVPEVMLLGRAPEAMAMVSDCWVAAPARRTPCGAFELYPGG